MDLRKILVLVLCFAVLLGVVGAYGYVEISNLRSQVDSLWETVSSLESERDSLQANVSSLGSQIEELQEEIDHLRNGLSYINNTRNFFFEWGSWEQNVTDDYLRMNLTFTLKQGNLSIIARINDDEYNGDDGFGIVFDLSENGEIGTGDRGLRFYAENTTKGISALDGGHFATTMQPPQPSLVHTCVFEPYVGYTFNISLSLSFFEYFTSSDLVNIAFGDMDCQGGVYITFHIGLSLEAP